MGMNVGNSTEGEPMVEVNTTPLIDLMLVLIVMLIITLPPQTHAVKLDNPPPNPPPPPPTPPEVVDIYVDFDGSIYWNNEKVDNANVLTTYLEQTASKVPMPEVHLRPNKLAKYDYVALVLATSQRLGVTNIGIVGNESM